ncbi:PH domain-containing protein [Kineosporia succinea]|uniref:Low molecular weight protein antigen 6 PH domain-containing protein n=1 Tax=Kineosporia succinea TaxID=84632 RepID=A0ABT9NV07_9ACTN|nr:PH domain-containing protein [Kineosporia succinea]MDP9824262.1 hypothetical protein [Kineosporia succinea]
MSIPGGNEQALADLHRPFVSRRGRIVAWVMGVGQAVAFVACILWVGASWGVYDKVGLLAVAAFIGWGMSRFGGVRATPSSTGLAVRNLLVTRQVTWAEIEDVNFGVSDPWVTLDTADGDPLAVMAVQRADGPGAQAEARRLATLVAYHRRLSS